MNKLILSFLLISIANLAFSQFESATTLGTLLSQNTLQGTARFVGTGGILGSVGGDLSNLSTNPAGIGMFSRSEFEISTGIQMNNVNTNYKYTGPFGNNSTVWDKNDVRFALNSLGIVIAKRNPEGSSLMASNVSIAFNRTHNFNRTIDFGVDNNRMYSYSNFLSDVATEYNNNSSIGYPPSGSLPIASDYFVLDNLYSRTLMARSAQLIFYDNTANQYIDPVPYQNAGNTIQSGYKKITGGVNELSVGWSGNVKDKIYVGVSMGIPIMRYRSELLISEDNNGATYASPSGYGLFQNYDLAENDLYTGTGINLKLGGLFKVNNNIKVSAYIHTPTYYEVSNTYAVGITTRYKNSTNPSTIELAEFTFNYITPFKAGGGISYLIGKKGFLGAEYEFNNVQATSIDLKNASANRRVNNFLSSSQNNTHTIRAGGELKSGIFRIRGGYNYRTSSVQAINNGGNENAAHAITGGLGIRGEQTALDLAFMRTQYEEYTDFYGVNNHNFGINTWNTQNHVVATFNYRF